MRFWHGVVMYAPQTPDFYAIPGVENCVFRLMQRHGDVQAWNLYWLSKPGIDMIPICREVWDQHYRPFDGEETRAFYEALDTPVFQHLTLATIVAQPPCEAIRLLRHAHLERTRFYQLFGGEEWRETLLGRLFLAERLSGPASIQARDADVLDFSRKQLKRNPPAA